VVADDVAEQSDWNELELLDRAEVVHEALGKLSLPHREVLTLRFLEELELSEIAQVVGCRVGTVKSRLHYAKAAIRQLLEEARHE
jgi:RNA polymerase sigma-70 factor, ECF subfamily